MTFCADSESIADFGGISRYNVTINRPIYRDKIGDFEDMGYVVVDKVSFLRGNETIQGIISEVFDFLMLICKRINYLLGINPEITLESQQTDHSGCCLCYYISDNFLDTRHTAEGSSSMIIYDTGIFIDSDENQYKYGKFLLTKKR
jgi:hypothetical protein